jgi:hypothetical protein
MLYPWINDYKDRLRGVRYLLCTPVPFSSAEWLSRSTSCKNRRKKV